MSAKTWNKVNAVLISVTETVLVLAGLFCFSCIDNFFVVMAGLGFFALFGLFHCYSNSLWIFDNRKLPKLREKWAMQYSEDED